MGLDARVQSVKSGAEIINPIACVPAVEIGEEDIRLAASVRCAARPGVPMSQIADARSVGSVASVYHRVGTKCLTSAAQITRYSPGLAAQVGQTDREHLFGSECFHIRADATTTASQAFGITFHRALLQAASHLSLTKRFRKASQIASRVDVRRELLEEADSAPLSIL
jgi:hypothetical protein